MQVITAWQAEDGAGGGLTDVDIAALGVLFQQRWHPTEGDWRAWHWQIAPNSVELQAAFHLVQAHLMIADGDGFQLTATGIHCIELLLDRSPPRHSLDST